MRPFKTLLVILVLLIGTESVWAGSYRSSAGNGYEFPNVLMTAYSAGHCGRDSLGGGNKASDGKNPRDHTLDNPKNNRVYIAVPQIGGNASLFLQCLAIDFSQSNVPSDIRARFKNKEFFAGDHLGPRSNFSNHIDVSLDCKDEVNNIKYQGVIVRQVPCQPEPVEVAEAPDDSRYDAPPTRRLIDDGGTR